MRISERVSMILQLEEQGPSDCKIARKINTDPSVTLSRKNAQKKLQNAQITLEWAERIGLSITIS